MGMMLGHLSSSQMLAETQPYYGLQHQGVSTVFGTQQTRPGIHSFADNNSSRRQMGSNFNGEPGLLPPSPKQGTHTLQCKLQGLEKSAAKLFLSAMLCQRAAGETSPLANIQSITKIQQRPWLSQFFVNKAEHGSISG